MLDYDKIYDSERIEINKISVKDLSFNHLSAMVVMIYQSYLLELAILLLLF